MQMATCYDRRQHSRNCISGAGKAGNAVTCARVSSGKIIVPSPELTQKTRSQSALLIYIINPSSDIDVVDLIENQDYLDYKQ